MKATGRMTAPCPARKEPHRAQRRRGFGGKIGNAGFGMAGPRHHLDPRAVQHQGDFAALPFAAQSFDTVVFHQVLHYAHQPDYALAEAARVCREGGRIAIVDLAAHDREDLRRTHAHARLGFDDAQIEAMLRESEADRRPN